MKREHKNRIRVEFKFVLFRDGIIKKATYESGIHISNFYRKLGNIKGFDTRKYVVKEKKVEQSFSLDD